MDRLVIFKIIDTIFLIFAFITCTLVPINILFFHEQLITSVFSFWVLYIYASFFSYFGFTGLFSNSIHIPVNKYSKYNFSDTFIKVFNIVILFLGLLIIVSMFF